MDKFVQVATGDSHSCGVRTNDTVACWRSNSPGEFMPPSGTFLQFAVAAGQTCGVGDDHAIACWASRCDKEEEVKAPMGPDESRERPLLG